MPPRVKSWFQTAAGAVVFALLVLVARLTWDAHRFVAFAEQHVQNRAYPEACAAFMDAARAYYPGNPFAQSAFARLLELADAGPGLGAAAPDLERRALEAFRTAAMATRSTYVPHAKELARVNDRLSIIYARWELQTRGSYKGDARDSSLQQRKQWHLAKLQEVPGPSWTWSVVTFLGVGLAGAAVVLFIAKALSPTLRVERGPALGAGLAFLVGFALFLMSLAH